MTMTRMGRLLVVLAALSAACGGDPSTTPFVGDQQPDALAATDAAPQGTGGAAGGSMVIGGTGGTGGTMVIGGTGGSTMVIGTDAGVSGTGGTIATADYLPAVTPSLAGWDVEFLGGSGAAGTATGVNGDLCAQHVNGQVTFTATLHDPIVVGATYSLTFSLSTTGGSLTNAGVTIYDVEASGETVTYGVFNLPMTAGSNNVSYTVTPTSTSSSHVKLTFSFYSSGSTDVCVGNPSLLVQR